ncbi:MAG: hypothetical protein WC139_12535 [Candidatus Kapaibacterium sp.]
MAVVIIVFFVMYTINSIEYGNHNEISVTNSNTDNSDSYGFINCLNTMPDYDELERVKSITGLDGILCFTYCALFIINLIVLRTFKHIESCSIVVAFGLYSGFALSCLLNVILLGNFSTWGFHNAFSLFLNGLGIGLLASLVSLSIHSFYKLVYTLKQEGVSLFEMIAEKVTTPDAKASLSSAGTWSLYSVLVFGLLLISIYF